MENILIFIQINYRFQTAIIYEQFKQFNGQKLLNTKIDLQLFPLKFKEIIVQIIRTAIQNILKFRYIN